MSAPKETTTSSLPVDESREAVEAAIQCADSTRQVAEDEDVTVNRSVNGILMQYANNTKIEVLSNEATRVKLSDGTVIEKFPNGAQTISLPNGVVVETKPDGTKMIRSASSDKIVKEFPDGRKVVLSADSASEDDRAATTISQPPPDDLDEDTTSDEEEEDALVEALQSLAEQDDEDDDDADDGDDGDRISATAASGADGSVAAARTGSVSKHAAAAAATGGVRSVVDGDVVGTGHGDGAAMAQGHMGERAGSVSRTASKDVDVPIHNSIIVCGWLWKEGGQIKSWKKRYFQLTEFNMLEYYDREPHRGGRFINVIDVFGGQVTPADDARRPHSFHLYVSCEPGTVSNKRSKYKLAALSGADREAWMEKLRVSAASKERNLTSVEQRPVVTRKFASRVVSLAKGPSLTNTVRKLVSKKKVRYQRDGFDLDLTYITPRIIAMGYPAEGTEAVYRNSYEDVYRMLQENHASHYKVYNLCSERAYPASRFHNRVAVYPFDDHNAPPLDLMLDFCKDLESYLGKHPRNVAAIHCKAGKGRTGVMICAYFMYSKMAANPDDAMFEFGSKRTANGKGVTIPSQRRYIRYFADVLQRSAIVPPPTPKILNRIHINDVPNFDLAGGCQPYFNVFQNGVFRYTSKPTEGAPLTFRRPPSSDMEFTLPLRLEGDVKIEFLNFDRVFHQDERMFAFTFYTGFLGDNKLRLTRQEIDGAHKRKHLKIFNPSFAVTLYFDDVEWASKDTATTTTQDGNDDNDNINDDATPTTTTAATNEDDDDANTTTTTTTAAATATLKPVHPASMRVKSGISRTSRPGSLVPRRGAPHVSPPHAQDTRAAEADAGEAETEGGAEGIAEGGDDDGAVEEQATADKGMVKGEEAEQPQQQEEEMEGKEGMQEKEGPAQESSPTDDQ